MSKGWSVLFTKKAAKQLKILPVKVHRLMDVLIWEIEEYGPVRGNWPNYSKLSAKRHHSHLNKKGRPTYVAVWEESEAGVKVIEVIYVGSREKAPY